MTPATDSASPVRYRWWLAAAGVLLQLSLGAVYAWSVFSKALQKDNAFALTKSQAALPFSVTIGMIFLGSFVGGRLQDRRGPRVVALAGGVVYAIGVLLAGVSSNKDQLWLLVGGYGVIAGFGLGLGYIVPVAMLQKWFPDHRGLITGIAVGGFGFGAVVTSPIAQRLVDHYHQVPTRSFLWLGVGYLILALVGASFFRNPPEGYQVPGWQPKTAAGGAGGDDYTPGEALRTPQWYLLTGILTLNVLAGISLISVASSAATDIAGYSTAAAATFTGVMGLFNGGGRIFWGWLSEHVGRMRAFTGMLFLQGVCFLVLPHAGAPALFAVLGAVVYLCYGGGFGTMPATAGDHFGLRSAGAIYGLMLLGWSLGGVVGPLLVAGLIDGKVYTAAFTTIGIIALVAIVLPLLTRRPAVRTPSTVPPAPDAPAPDAPAVA
ncbi:L-lactate MFS transporter [Rugosimonospora africana]|uniref:MFS transporter n=1 Tax=Rugosimonospora africana TaxID=556532 RepID=A0A8J3R3U0_9ACTN|nr:OFA family MFS transporter [Rugosimonospora africana]GIH20870.1 MFS transporter [Rugosimonospora africana]